MPKVSIIVPNYNHARFLKQRLDSIFNQTYQDFEVILLDDCSSDTSIEILQTYSQNPKVSHYSINSKNSGSTFKQWNKGFSLAKGEYIWIAESDDWADETFLEKQIPILDVNENVGVIYCQSYRTNIDSKIHEKIDNSFDDYTFKQGVAIVSGKKFIIEKMVDFNSMPNASAIIFRKEILLKVGYANENTRLFSDWLQWINILAVSDLAICESYLNYFREHQSTVRKSIPHKIYYNEYFDFILRLYKINRKHLSKGISTHYINCKLRELFLLAIQFGGTTFGKRIIMSLQILKIKYNSANIILCFGMIINSSRYDFYFDENPLQRIRGYFQRKIKF
jgi:glycosyltransferase involved in cell wall biosynthesis